MPFHSPVCVSGSFCTVSPHSAMPLSAYASMKRTYRSASACCRRFSDESIPA